MYKSLETPSEWALGLFQGTANTLKQTENPPNLVVWKELYIEDTKRHKNGWGCCGNHWLETNDVQSEKYVTSTPWSSRTGPKLYSAISS